jgi:hypothetical protein
MWYDKRAIYTPSMKYRKRILPPGSWAILIVTVLFIALLGDRIIHGFFWLTVHFGKWIFQALGGDA